MACVIGHAVENFDVGGRRVCLWAEGRRGGRKRGGRKGRNGEGRRGRVGIEEEGRGGGWNGEGGRGRRLEWGGGWGEESCGQMKWGRMREGRGRDGVGEGGRMGKGVRVRHREGERRSWMGFE